MTPPGPSGASAQHQPILPTLPYGWAEKVLTDLNGKALLGRFPISIDNVRDAAVRIADANNISYRPFQTASQKIIGRFTRYHVTMPNLLRPFIEVVIDYDSTLPLDLQRLVIMKEISHTFYSDDPITRSVTEEQMMALMEGLAAMNAPRDNGGRILPQSPPLRVEEMAMYTALEILCPFEVREEIIQHFRGDYAAIPVDKLSAEFALPSYAVRSLFSSGYHDNARISRSIIIQK